MESREKKKNDAPVSNWNAAWRDDHGSGHVGVRNSCQRLSVANGDLQPRWRSLDRRPEWAFGLEVAG